MYYCVVFVINCRKKNRYCVLKLVSSVFRFGKMYSEVTIMFSLILHYVIQVGSSVLTIKCL